jgi:hypothetical protein
MAIIIQCSTEKAIYSHYVYYVNLRIRYSDNKNKLTDNNVM